MRLEGWLEEVGRQATWRRFWHLRSLVGSEWVRQALQRTDTETIRRRKLPNEAVVWLVMAIALFRGFSIPSVLKHLGLARAKAPQRPSPSGTPVSSAGVADARRRIGAGPLLELFYLTSQRWSQEFAFESSNGARSDPEMLTTSLGVHPDHSSVKRQEKWRRSSQEWRPYR